MSVTTGGVVRAINAGSAAPTIQLSADVAAGDAIFVGIRGGDETTALTDITDPVNGTWAGATLRQGPTDSAGSTFRSWIAVLENSAALVGATDRTLTINLGASIASQIVAGWARSSLGALTFDAVAAVLNQSASGTNLDSNLATATGAGIIIGFAVMNNAQGGDPTMDGAGETLLSTNEAGARTFAFKETYASAGDYGLEVTLASAAICNFHVVALKEPAAGGSSILKQMRRYL